MIKTCVFGGHYGSEGKGSLAEYLASNITGKIIVAGENSPNSGHTCSKGKTQNIPASSFWADAVLLGPDSVIDSAVLNADLSQLSSKLEQPPMVYIHQNAAWMEDKDKRLEEGCGIIKRVSSTGSGSGGARFKKQFYRMMNATIGGVLQSQDEVNATFGVGRVSLLNHSQYLSFIETYAQTHYWIFECSQGALLDINWGIYPYCTSRTTQPRVAIERNGLGGMEWRYAGVYRTYPIRTGGPSGPTGGGETSCKTIGVPDEIASVTKRIRRIFEFSSDDFRLSLTINRPDIVAFTHLDYLRLERDDYPAFITWLGNCHVDMGLMNGKLVMLSDEIGKFSTFDEL